MKHSMRKQLVILLVGMVCFALLLIGVINYFFLGSFYTKYKTRQLMTMYEAINAAETESMLSGSESSSSEAESAASDAENEPQIGTSAEMPDNDVLPYAEEFPNEIRQLSVQDNIQAIVTDSDFRIEKATGRDTIESSARLFGYFTGFYRGTVTVLEETGSYVLQRTDDDNISTEYLELWGQLDSGGFFLLRTPLESIENAARISNLFFIAVGALSILISVILIWFLSKRFTEPIRQLTELSQKMAGLDFEAKYTGPTDSEIGQLGTNFNKMSDELEKTISELKSANVELQKDVEKKTRIDEARREFLNNVTHELKTPLALIQGYAEGLKDNVAEDAESRGFYCEVIMDEAGKMNSMVKKLLTLNQLEFGNDQPVMDRFDLTELVRGVIAGMKILIEEKGARVSFDDSGSVWVWGDAFKIEEVVTNYLSNALNHLDYDKRIEVSFDRSEDGIVTTTVFNTGDPIPEDDLGHVFEKFFKVDKARTRAYGGSGIGLSIVKAIMDAHSQRCGAENYANGVAFWFTLEGK